MLRLGTFPSQSEYDGVNLHGFLCHAKRRRNASKDQWLDVQHFDRRTLRPDEYVRMELGPNSLLAIFRTLAEQYQAMGGLERALEGISVQSPAPVGIDHIDDVDLRALRELKARDADFWSHVRQIDTTNALRAHALHSLHLERVAALKSFKDHLELASENEPAAWVERDWEAFFSENEWIFGLGLSYCYLGLIRQQAQVGNPGIDRSGTNVVDFLMETHGNEKFVVLVDIKTPQTRLLQVRQYRSETFAVSNEVSGGVAQMQNYCHKWETGITHIHERANKTITSHTYRPKGMLIVGSLDRLSSVDHIQSFELYRRNLNCPEIVTFDELYHRAEHIVALTEPSELRDAA